MRRGRNVTNCFCGFRRYDRTRSANSVSAGLCLWWPRSQERRLPPTRSKLSLRESQTIPTRSSQVFGGLPTVLTGRPRVSADLDREIAAHDQGYRSQGGRKIPGADADLSGPADASQTGMGSYLSEDARPAGVGVVRPRRSCRATRCSFQYPLRKVREWYL